MGQAQRPAAARGALTRSPGWPVAPEGANLVQIEIAGTSYSRNIREHEVPVKGFSVPLVDFSPVAAINLFFT